MRGMFGDRRAVAIENDDLRVTVLQEGGHIAEILDKRSGINPLWSPPWPSIEPSEFDASSRDAYGAGIDAKLLAGIMGHNLCLDIFGGPGDEEAAAGLTPHGEAPVIPYECGVSDGSRTLTMKAGLPLARLRFERTIELHGRHVRIRESLVNVADVDRPIGWTQHVTLGPPFLQKGITEFRASASRSKAHETGFGAADYIARGAEFAWPFAPGMNGRAADLRVLPDVPSSSAYTAHLMDAAHEHAFFVAYSPVLKLAFGYVWRCRDFPWMGIWEENHSRQAPPWNGRTLARGMEFGVSPFPETRQQMVDRGSLFGVRTYRWLPARARLEAEYWAVASTGPCVPETLEWPGARA
jgi:hypothetical protein